MRELGDLVPASGGAFGASYGVSVRLLPGCEVESVTGPLSFVRTSYAFSRETGGKR